QPARGRGLWVARHRAGLHNGDARAEVEAEREHVTDVFDPRFLVFGDIKAAAQRAAQGGQLQVVGTQQVAHLAPARLRQRVRGQVSRGVHLDAGYAQALRLLQRAAEGESQRFEADTELDPVHGRFTIRTGRISPVGPASRTG